MPIALKYLLGFIVVAAVVIAGFGAFWPKAEVVPMQPVVEEEGEPQGEPTFRWVYSTDESGEIPRTKITLRAMYFDGISRTKEIDTVDGTCNTYPSPDDDVYPKSDQIICYYAGFGRYYKVVATGNGTYSVQRREFEEASPDYAPPVAAFETIAEFEVSSSNSETSIPARTSQSEVVIGMVRTVGGNEVTVEIPEQGKPSRVIVFDSAKCVFSPQVNKLYRFEGVRKDASSGDFACTKASQVSFSGSDQ